MMVASRAAAFLTGALLVGLGCIWWFYLMVDFIDWLGR